MQFKVAGLKTFGVEFEQATAVRDLKRLVKAECDIEPEHMRLIYKGRQLKEDDT
eukprot:CAMPEP_0195108766 /NCGR_PEP_ID=MMETSP0448-20130528/86575_1 /TAXON_ID=66468 /ORGANISM="Heterocapsa triquestra, Strain CCMP 448" /LENGTH=53 /DNA_ID=CAMNT_0040145327 /DNA_START=66 /DNA_END=223 /DNA_ORIENTATION=-